eukprot:c4477_g1_i2.p1 GENE.c4477_g1_i2~~c4477_g1_i2.p1  ORF type:complete len:239 (-),score=30.32 c4477_g1_i2:170-886(-)
MLRWRGFPSSVPRAHIFRFATQRPVQTIPRMKADKKQSRSWWQWAKQTTEAHPFVVGVGVATLEAAGADLVVQHFVEKRETIDLKRLGVFTTFGFAYLGVVQYFIYVTLFKAAFRHANHFGALSFREKLKHASGMKELAAQVALDNVAVGPLVFFPAYYIVNEGFREGSHNQSLLNTTLGGIQRFQTNFWEDMVPYWQVWIPGDALIFALPFYARLPVTHFMSFAYVCLISFMRGSED